MTEQHPHPRGPARRRLGCALALLLLAFAPAAAATEYWAVSLPNYTGYDAEIILTNSDTVAHNAVIDTPGFPSTTVAVPPLGTATHTMTPPLAGTTQTNVGVHRVTTDPEVLLGYYDPLSGAPYTNDAGRLFEKGELGTEYWTFSVPSGTFLTVIATEPSTTVSVTPTAATTAGGPVPAIAAGATHTTTLNAFDVLNIEAPGDLQGSHIVSDKPVAAFSGNRCVAIGASACDHISEQIQPLSRADTTHVVCASTPARAGNPTVDLMRVMATAAGTTTVSVTPPGSLGATVTLTGPGDWTEFTIAQDTVIDGDQAILVGQFYKDSLGQGDPAWVEVSPTSAYTTSRAFYSAVDWDHYVLVGAPLGTTTTIDGTPLPALTPIAGTGYGCASTPVADGTHFTSSSGPSLVIDLGVQEYKSVWFEAPSPNVDPVEPEPCAMTGRAYVAHARLEDVGNTGYVGPTDVWSEDTGDIWTTASEHHWAGLASTTGPLFVGDAVAGVVDTYADPDCRSEARASVVHLEDGPNLPAGLAPFELRAVESWSTTDCASSNGDTTIGYLMVGGTVLVDTSGTPAPNTAVTVGPATVILNEHIAGAGVLEVNAVHILVPGVIDVKLLSARSDIHNCTPPPPPEDPCPPLPIGIDTPIATDAGTTPGAELPVTPAIDPCVCEDLKALGLPCDPCDPIRLLNRVVVLPCDPCQNINPCDPCDLSVVVSVIALPGGVDCVPPCLDASTTLQGLIDCIERECDSLLAQLGLILRCRVGPIGPLPTCALPAQDIVGGVLDCVNTYCNAIVGALGPIACAIGDPLPPISCGTVVSCVEQVCDTLVAPLGADCAIAQPAAAALPVPAPWASDALGTPVAPHVFAVGPRI